MTKKCWICGEDINESTTTNEPSRFYGAFNIVTVNMPFAKNNRWKGSGWICQKCMEETIGIDHNGKSLK